MAISSFSELQLRLRCRPSCVIHIQKPRSLEIRPLILAPMREPATNRSQNGEYPLTCFGSSHLNWITRHFFAGISNASESLVPGMSGCCLHREVPRPPLRNVLMRASDLIGMNPYLVRQAVVRVARVNLVTKASREIP